VAKNEQGKTAIYDRARYTFSYFQHETVVLSYGEYKSDLDICSCRICWRTRPLRHGRRRPMNSACTGRSRRVRWWSL